MVRIRATSLIVACLAAACELDIDPPREPLETAPAWTALLVGDSVRLTVTRHGEAIPGGQIRWETSRSTVVTVSPDGFVRARGHGAAEVRGRYGMAEARAIVAVAPPVVVGAGDIASCASGGDDATARLLDGIPGVVYTTGDNAYPDGSAAQYGDCYHPSWGRHRLRTRPALGNRDYRTAGAGPAFDYFGALAGERGAGYYSWDFAGWHFIALNSEVAMDAASPQGQWLRDDLAGSAARCVLAYWHHPLFSSDPGRTRAAVRPLWRALHAAGADVILAAHSHTYERFAPQDADGAADPDRGLRQFVVGTGGESHHAVTVPAANSEVRDGTSFGVLRLTLRPDGYDWEFIPVAGATFTDAGSGSCH